MKRALLIAKSFSDANRAARIDWGWEPLQNRNCWLRPDGVEVVYCAKPDGWRGWKNGTLIITGPGWWDSDALGRDRSDLHEMRKRFRFAMYDDEVSG